MAHLPYTRRREHPLWGANQYKKKTTRQKAYARLHVIIGAVYQAEQCSFLQCTQNMSRGTEGVSADASAMERVEAALRPQETTNQRLRQKDDQKSKTGLKF